MKLVKTTEPAAEPVSIDEIKAHTNIEDVGEDPYLNDLLFDAREFVEAELGRALIEQEWLLECPCFEAELRLPKPPLISVVSVKYLDGDAQEQTLDPSGYDVRYRGSFAHLILADGAAWPATAVREDAVRIAYRAGYGSAAADVPRPIRRAIMMTAATLYEFREEEVIGASKSTVALGIQSQLARYMVARQ